MGRDGRFTIVGALVLALGMLAAPGGATAGPGGGPLMERAANGTISGTVTDDLTGGPILNVSVSIEGWSGGFYQSVATDASGFFSMSAPPGRYRVHFWESTHREEYWNNKAEWADANPVRVDSGATTTVDAGLQPGTLISGTITDSVDGSPLYGIWVSAYSVSASAFPNWLDVRSDENGDYELWVWEPGDYKVLANGGEEWTSGEFYRREWFDDSTFGGATILSLTPGATAPNTDFALDRLGSISGVVTDEVGGTPLSSINVSAYSVAQGAYVPRFAWSAWNGEYVIRGLDPGDYLIVANTGVDGNTDTWYLGEWYDNVPSMAAATPVTVSDNTTVSGIDLALNEAGSIAGTVTDEVTGLPVELVEVLAYSVAEGRFVRDRYVWTDGAGEYLIGGLGAGDYLVRFKTTLPWRPIEWYDEVPNRAAATPVIVSLGSTTTGVDATLWHPMCAGRPATFWGTNGPETIVGSDGDDVIHGLRGDDTIFGLNGNDVLCGGSGSDTIDGGDGSDRVYGGSGFDTILGGPLRDILNGGDGSDHISGGSGNDTIIGGSGNDRLDGDPGDDSIFGNAGRDIIYSGEGSDTVSGGPAGDVLNGGQNDDILHGDGGNDLIRGGTHDDLLVGSSGRDTLIGGSGVDVLKGGPGSDTCSLESVNVSCEILL